MCQCIGIITTICAVLVLISLLKFTKDLESTDSIKYLNNYGERGNKYIDLLKTYEESDTIGEICLPVLSIEDFLSENFTGEDFRRYGMFVLNQTSPHFSVKPNVKFNDMINLYFDTIKNNNSFEFSIIGNVNTCLSIKSYGQVDKTIYYLFDDRIAKNTPFSRIVEDTVDRCRSDAGMIIGTVLRNTVNRMNSEQLNTLDRIGYDEFNGYFKLVDTYSCNKTYPLNGFTNRDYFLKFMYGQNSEIIIVDQLENKLVRTELPPGHYVYVVFGERMSYLTNNKITSGLIPFMTNENIIVNYEMDPYLSTILC
jgi:hypothetical protein